MKTYRVPVHFEPGVSSSILSAYVTLPAPPWRIEQKDVLTREDVRNRVAAGEAPSAVAECLGISHSTVLRALRRGQKWKS